MNTWQDISKLPTECEDVLIYAHDRMGAYFLEVAYLLEGNFISSDSGDYVCSGGFYVTHWMPLPEVPTK